MASPPSLQLGVGEASGQPQCGVFTHGCSVLVQILATHSSVLAWRIPGTGEPGGLPSMGSHRVGQD